LLLDAVTDPIVGNISDRARFKNGRRGPFFIAGATQLAPPAPPPIDDGPEPIKSIA
jgi:hypothetical protein